MFNFVVEYLPGNSSHNIVNICKPTSISHFEILSKNMLCCTVCQYLCIHLGRAPPTSFNKFRLSIKIPSKIENSGYILIISGPTFSSYSGSIYKNKIMSYCASIFACSLQPRPPKHLSIISCCGLRLPLKSNILIIYSAFPGRLFHPGWLQK